MCYEKEAKGNIQNQEGGESLKVMDLQLEEEISSHPSSYPNAKEEKKHSKVLTDKKRPLIRAWRTSGLYSLVNVQEKT